MRAKFGRDPMAGSKKVTIKFIIGYTVLMEVGPYVSCTNLHDVKKIGSRQCIYILMYLYFIYFMLMSM